MEVERALTAVNSGLGTHSNTLTLQASAGNSYTVSMGPYWYMTQNGSAFQVGETVRIRMALCQGKWVAFGNPAHGRGAPTPGRPGRSPLAGLSFLSLSFAFLRREPRGSMHGPPPFFLGGLRDSGERDLS